VRPPDAGQQPIDIRLFLRLGDKALTETWLYQWAPPGRSP
jgi:glucans biosynthesis protein